MTESTVADVAQMREARTSVVHGLYRLLKVCFLHQGATNDAVVLAASTLASAVENLCQRTASTTASLVFIGDAVFVNGVILKASRETLALALELGELLAACDVSEVTFVHNVERREMTMFARLLADVFRDRSTMGRLLTEALPGITTGRAKPFASADADDSQTSRAAKTYALAIMSVQRMTADLRRGKLALPRKIKRIAQRIVADADADARALVALAAVGGSVGDSAGIAVASAVLAVAMARQLTSERHLLLNAAMTALLHDAGQPRLAASVDSGVTRTLNEDELDRVPASSAVILTAMGKIHPSARERTVLVYETWWRRRAHRVGPVYNGRRTPTVLSRVTAVARAFAELRATQETGGTLSIDDALQVLMNRAEDATERTFVKLLQGGLGIFPAGTMVELNTGELAVVMSTPAAPVDFVRPPVKIMYDAHANLLDEPFDVDLAAPRPDGTPLRFIRRTIHADDAQLKAMRSFVVAATASTRRAALEPAGPTAPPPRVQRAPPAATTAPPPSSVAVTTPPRRKETESGPSALPPQAPVAPTDPSPRAAQPPSEPPAAPLSASERDQLLAAFLAESLEAPSRPPPAPRPADPPPSARQSGSVLDRNTRPLTRTDSNPAAATGEAIQPRSTPTPAQAPDSGLGARATAVRKLGPSIKRTDSEPPPPAPEGDPATPVVPPPIGEVLRQGPTGEVNWSDYAKVVDESSDGDDPEKP